MQIILGFYLASITDQLPRNQGLAGRGKQAQADEVGLNQELAKFWEDRDVTDRCCDWVECTHIRQLVGRGRQSRIQGPADDVMASR